MCDDCKPILREDRSEEEEREALDIAMARDEAAHRRLETGLDIVDGIVGIIDLLVDGP